MQEMAGILDLKLFLGGGMPWTRLDISHAFVDQFVPHTSFLTLAPPLPYLTTPPGLASFAGNSPTLRTPAKETNAQMEASLD